MVSPFSWKISKLTNCKIELQWHIHKSISIGKWLSGHTHWGKTLVFSLFAILKKWKMFKTFSNFLNFRIFFKFSAQFRFFPIFDVFRKTSIWFDPVCDTTKAFRFGVGFGYAIFCDASWLLLKNACFSSVWDLLVHIDAIKHKQFMRDDTKRFFPAIKSETNLTWKCNSFRDI